MMLSLPITCGAQLVEELGPGASPFSRPFDNVPAPAGSIARLPPVEAQPIGAEITPENTLEEPDWMASPVELASYSPSHGAMEAWPQGFHVGGIQIVPYGIFWSDMIYASSRQFPRRFILFIESEETQGEDAFEVEMRYTRVGMRLTGPRVNMLGGLTSGGQVEVDFLGGFVTENQPDTRLRHAYWEAKNDDYRFLVGQYWDLTSPLLPNTINFSVNWAAGNIGFRRAQFRVERYLDVSDNFRLTLQAAAASEVIQDFRTADDIGRESPNWPMIQARTAMTVGDRDSRPVTLGFSGHIGETGFDFESGHPANPALGPEDDARFRTWSFNVDFTVPVTHRLGVHGEFFTGANLSPLLGGILQGVCPCLRVPIRSTGGWAEIWYDVNPCVHFHVGFGIDDPVRSDIVVGRSYNRVVYTNVLLDVTKRLVTGLEVSSWKTNYTNRSSEPGFTPVSSPTLPGEAIAIDWTVRYAF